MSVLGLNSNDKKSTRDKAKISNPKVNRGCAPLPANRISADCAQISLGSSMPYIPLGVYHTGGLNAMDDNCHLYHFYNDSIYATCHCQNGPHAFISYHYSLWFIDAGKKMYSLAASQYHGRPEANRRICNVKCG